MCPSSKAGIFFALCCAVVSAFPAAAQPLSEDWVMIHGAAVDPSQTRQVITMPAGTPRTLALRLVARGGAVSIQRIAVHYGNGQVHYETGPNRLPIDIMDGERTREIDNRMANEFMENFKGRHVESRIVESIWLELVPLTKSTPEVKIEVWGLRPSQQSRLGPVSDVRQRGDEATGVPPGPNKRYIEVPVLYGTTRAKAGERIKRDRKLVSYNSDQSNDLSLGLSIVTVPLEREVGTIPRPSTLPILRFGFRNEDPNRDFTLAMVEELTDADFRMQLSGQVGVAKKFHGQAIVFVHGYNMAFEDAIFRTAQIVTDIGFDGPAVTFSWPSAGGLLDYDHDRETAKSARPGLRKLLETIVRDTGVTAVNLIAHSMGNDPVMEVLREQGEIISRGGQTVDLKLNEIVLAAPDISRAVFEQFAPQFVRLALGGVTLYASSNDLALKASGKKARGLVRAGDLPKEGIVIVPGLESIDISEASTSFLSLNHSNFADRAHIITDLQLLFERTGNDTKRPPHVRFAVYRLQGPQQKRWWQYKKN